MPREFSPRGRMVPVVSELCWSRMEVSPLRPEPPRRRVREDLLVCISGVGKVNAALAALELDDPDRITVTYDDGSYTLLLGDTDESGNYYGQLEGSYQVGLLSPGYVEDLLALPTAQTQAEADAQAAAEAEAEADGETSAPSETAAPAETSAGEDGAA